MDNNNQLVHITKADITKGGLGFGSSKLFKLQPATLQLVQKMTRAEGAIPGQIRVKETGQHFKEMRIVLLFEPVERRSFYDGDDFSPENLVCFSTDMEQPHERAQVPQAEFCSGCTKADWSKYTQTKDRRDIPPCKPFWRCLVIDCETKLPYKLDIRGTSRNPFKLAMQNIARIYALMQSQGKNPNVFDIAFTIYPVAQEKGTYYTLGFKDFSSLDEKDKEAFGELFLDFVNRQHEMDENESKTEVTKSNEVVNQTIVEGGEAVEGDYITL